MFIASASGNEFEANIREIALANLAHHPKAPETAVAFDQLGFVYMRSGRYEEAERSYELTLSIFEKGPASTSERNRVLNNLVFVKRQLGKTLEASVLFDEVHEGFKSYIAPENPDTLVDTLNFACNLFDQGYDLMSAKTLSQIGTKISGEQTLIGEINRIRFNQACALSSSGRTQEADDILKRLTPAFGTGAEPGRYVMWLDLDGMNRFRDGKYHEARMLFDKAIKVAVDNFGDRSDEVCHVSANKALNASYLGDGEEARVAIGRAEDIAARFRTSEDEYARVLNIKGFLAMRGQVEENPEKLYSEALRIRQNAIGKDNPRCAIIINNIAYNNVLKGQWLEAVDRFEEARAIAEKRLGKDHPVRRTIERNVSAVRNPPVDALPGAVVGAFVGGYLAH